MDEVLDRIDAWQEAGLIDDATAARLRAAEADRVGFEDVAPPNAHRSGHHTLSSVFGPGVAVGEMFAYLGLGFLLAAWTAFVGRLAGEQASTTTIGLGALAAAGVLTAIGVFMHEGDARRRRAAGVAFLVAIAYVAGAMASLVSGFQLESAVLLVVVAAVALGVAAFYRLVHAALLTELGLIATFTAFGAAMLGWAQSLLNPPQESFLLGRAAATDPSPLVLLILTALGWLAVALVLGLFALAEVRFTPDVDDDPDAAGAARRRATLTRAWAGVAAVLGLTSALTQRNNYADDFGRVIPAWLADAAILVLAIVLVERAFRRDSGAFLFAAAIGLIAALTDFTNTYLATTAEVGLLAEGAILLGVGFGADRLRRRLNRSGDGAPGIGNPDGSGELDEPEVAPA